MFAVPELPAKAPMYLTMHVGPAVGRLSLRGEQMSVSRVATTSFQPRIYEIASCARPSGGFLMQISYMTFCPGLPWASVSEGIARAKIAPMGE